MAAVLTTLAAIIFGGYEYATNESATVNNVATQPAIVRKTPSGNLIDQTIYNQLATMGFSSDDSVVVEVNHGLSTLDLSQWESHVEYGELGEFNRATTVTAYTNKNNLGRSRQVLQPMGWHQKIDGETIYNRGHLLFYTSSFNFDEAENYVQGESGSEDNPKNSAMQTAYSNQRVQTTYE